MKEIKLNEPAEKNGLPWNDYIDGLKEMETYCFEDFLRCSYVILFEVLGKGWKLIFFFFFLFSF